MNQKRIKARLVPKGDTEANLNKATGFIPLEKEIIIYKPDEKHNYSRFKIGDGVTPVSDLPFAAESIIDVDTLPNQKIDTNTFYRLKIDIPASIDFMAGGAAILEEELSMNFTIVDTLPENATTMEADTGYVNIFIRTDKTGWVYVDEYSTPVIGMDKGWYTLEEAGLPSKIVSSPEEAQDPNPEFLYIIYKEAISEYKLYYYTDRWQEVDGEDNAIVDVSSLPTAEINKNIFYRLIKETPSDLYIMQEGEKLSDEQVEELGVNAIIVDVLPENPTTLDAGTGKINAYIRSDLTGWVYIEKEFSEEQELGLEAGWYSFEQFGQPHKVVSSPEEAQDAEPGILYFVYEAGGYEYKLYYYNDEWVEVGGGIDTSIIPTKLSELENDSQYIAKPELEQKYVKKTDYAVTDGDYGLVKLTDANSSGIGRDTSGRLVIFGANETDIDSKETSRKPITPSELDYAIKVGMTTNTETWSEDTKETQDGKEVTIKGDKTKARELIGAVGFTDYAGQDKAGVIKVRRAQGLGILEGGYLYVYGCTDGDLQKRGESGYLRASNVDSIVRIGLTTNKKELTADERASAQKWLGIDTLVGDIEAALDSILALQNTYLGGES